MFRGQTGYGRVGVCPTQAGRTRSDTQSMDDVVSPCDGAVADAAFPGPAPKTAGVASVVVTGMIGVGKSTVMPRVKALLEDTCGVEVCIAKEGADEEPFASALKYTYTGVEEEGTGETLRMDKHGFQNLVTHLRAIRQAEAMAWARVAHASTGKPVVVLFERCRQDAGEIFIPANRRMEAPTRHQLFDLSTLSWYAVAKDRAEFVPDAVVTLRAPLDRVLARCAERDRGGEKGYVDMLEPGTGKPYRHILWEAYNAMCDEQRWNTALPGAQYVADAYKDVEAVAADVVSFIRTTVLPSVA